MSATVNYSSMSSPLSHYVTDIPQEKANELKTKSRLANLASKVCMAAFIAIVALALSISLGLLPPISPLLLIGLVIATVPLQAAFAHMQTKSLHLNHQYLTEQAKADTLKAIQNWGTKEIETFLEMHKIEIQDLPMDALRRINASEPLKALLPAIARYRYWNDLSKEYAARHLREFTNKMENPTLRLEERRMAWTRLEEEVIPSALNAALMLEVISKPTFQLEWESLGECKKKHFDQRFLDRMVDQEDDYFRFNDPKRSSLTLTQIYETLPDADVLREMLFPRPKISSEPTPPEASSWLGMLFSKKS